MQSSRDSRTEGRRIYAVPDIHGHLELLDQVLARIRADLRDRPHPAPLLVFLGDYCDRGPDTRGVLARLIELRQGPVPVVTLLGNHDSYILAYRDDPTWFDRPLHWLHASMGGDRTLASYGVPDASEADPEATHAAFVAQFPAAHLDFLHDCQLWHRVGGYVFVHAGIRPGVGLEDQKRDDCIWIREPFLSSRDDFGFKVVHGHTIVPTPQHHSNRIALDTGAFRTGRLVCLVLEDDSLALLGDGPFPEGTGVETPGLIFRLRRLLPGG